MVFRVLGFVMVVVAGLGLGSCSDDSGGGAAGSGANSNFCAGGSPNGTVEQGEQCDTGGVPNMAVPDPNVSCAGLGLGGGIVTCSTGCAFVTTGCSMGGNNAMAGSGI